MTPDTTEHVPTPAAAAGELTLGGDLTVRRMAYGAMRLCGPGIWGPPADPTVAPAVLHRALELGVTLVDTSDAYGPEVNEQQVADALHPYPVGVVIATKGGLLRDGPGLWRPCGRPDHLRAACEGSLRRLRVDAIDLYQLHAPDPAVPFAESVGALAELQRDGLIRHVGLSNVTVEQLDEARAIVPIVSVQNRYNLADRGHEPVLAACERLGIAFLPWFPLAMGELAAPGSSLDAIATAHGATPAQVALAWLLQHSPVTCPIPGTASVGHLAENVAAASLQLTDEQSRSLDGLAATRLTVR